MDWIDDFYTEWYSSLSLDDKAEVDAYGDMWDEWDFLLEDID